MDGESLLKGVVLPVFAGEENDLQSIKKVHLVFAPGHNSGWVNMMDMDFIPAEIGLQFAVLVEDKSLVDWGHWITPYPEVKICRPRYAWCGQR